jgi:Carboxypeptidase regulatory-like domain/TonB dependent receptor
MRFRSYKALILSACLAMIPASGFGQSVYGSIYGSVTDNTGAAIPNATVTITDTNKGTTDNVLSNGAGEYRAEHLIPDIYTVKVTVSGFKSSETKGITVYADQSLKVDAKLEVGGSTESVEVNADAIPLLKTDRADVSTTFSQKEVQDLPIGDRNFTNLQLLLPGAQQLGWSHAASENPQASKQIQVDGQAFGGVAFELDGTDNQDPILGIIVINPNMDALSETKITTQNFDAQFGKAVASIVTAQTKSGTNSFHGSVFDYRTSGANLARDPYTQSPTAVIPGSLKNQFGGSIGGPIIKNKLFFFGDYQGLRQKVGLATSSAVPTALVTATCLGQKVGPSGIPGCDFSEYAGNTAYGSGLIYHPTGLLKGQHYVGNVIPAAEVSPQSLNILTLLAPYTPNKTGSGNLVDQYAASGTGGFNSDSWDARGDWQATSSIHVFGRYSRFTDTLTGKTLFGAAGGPGFGIGGFAGTSNGTNDSVAAGTDVAINNNLLTDIRLGYYRYNIVTAKYDQGVDFANQVGIPGLNTGTSYTSGSPAFEIDQNSSNGFLGSGLNVNRCNCQLTEKEQQGQVVNNWTKILGNHAFKFGADLRYATNLRVPSDSNRTGQLVFQNGQTSDPALSSPGGLGWASFSLGNVQSFQRYVSVSTNAKEDQKRFFFYGQDTWRLTPALTLNLGLRYELWYPESVNAKGNGALMNLNTGFLQVAGYGNIPSNMGWERQKNTWSPRIGLAYQLDPKTVIRSGYGRSFDIGVFGSIFGHVVTQNLPVLANQSLSGSGDATTFAFNLADGPAAYVFPTVPTNGLLPVPGYQVNAKTRPNPLLLPTVDAWNLSIQRSITSTLSTTIAYVGNKSTHTLGAGDSNNTNPNESALNLPSQYSVTGAPTHWDPNVAGGIIAPDGGTSTGKFLQRFYGGSLAACQGADYQLAMRAAVNDPLLPAGACGWNQGVSNYSDNLNAEFDALQVTIAKQFSKGNSFNVNYAWNRGWDEAAGYSTWSVPAGRGRNNDIREQQLVAYGVYQLPLGKNGSTIMKAIAGGWQVSPVVNWSGGTPFTLGYNECNASVGGTSAPCYPNGRAGGLKANLSGFNPGSANRIYYQAVSPNILTHPMNGFSAAGLDQIGNSGRNNKYGPGFFNADLSVQKNIPIHEQFVAQFRTDFFNVFNHINPGNPGGNLESAGTITGQAPAGTPRFIQLSLRLQF